MGEIAERAMVSRAAFYRYYQDKYDLVEKIFADAMQTLIHEMDITRENAAIRHSTEFWIEYLDQGIQMERTPEPMVRLFDHFAAYKSLYRALLGGKGSSWFRSRMSEYLADLFFERTQDLLFPPNKKSIAESREFAEGLVPTLLAGMLIDTLTWWLEQEKPYPARHIATYCHRLLLTNMREVSKWQ